MDASESPRRDPEERRLDRTVRGYSWFYALLAVIVIALVVWGVVYRFSPVIF